MKSAAIRPDARQGFIYETLYSFDATDEAAQASYRKMYELTQESFSVAD